MTTPTGPVQPEGQPYGMPPQSPPYGAAAQPGVPGQVPPVPLAQPGQQPAGHDPAGQHPAGQYAAGQYPGDAAAMPTGGSSERNRLAVLGLVSPVAGVVATVIVVVFGYLVPYLLIIGGAIGLNYGRQARAAAQEGRANNGGLGWAGIVVSVLVLLLGIAALIWVRVQNS